MQEVFEKIIRRIETAISRSDNANFTNGLLSAKDIIKQEADQYNNGWIPCEKEMPPIPEENPMFENKPLELYLVSVEGEKYPFRAFWNGKFFTDGFSKVEATAWQQLPPEYQPKGE